MKILLINVVVMLVSCNPTGGFQPSDDILVNISRLIYQIQSLPDKVDVNFFKQGTKIPQPAITYIDGSGMDLTFPNSKDTYYNVVVFGLSGYEHVCAPNKQLVYANVLNVLGGDISTGSPTVNSTKPVQEIGVVAFRQTNKIDPLLVQYYLSGKLTGVSCFNINEYSANFNLYIVAGTYLKYIPSM